MKKLETALFDAADYLDMESRKKLLPRNSLRVLLIKVDWECSVGVWLR